MRQTLKSTIIDVTTLSRLRWNSMRITEAADLVAPEEELLRSLANDLFSYYIRRVVAVAGFLSRFSARIHSPLSPQWPLSRVQR